jgi:hypothetical protein
MAADCPCGCGRKIPRLGKRTTERAVFIASLSELPEHLAEVFAPYDVDSAMSAMAFCQKGMTYSEILLAFAHQDAAGLRLPSAKELGDWEAAALELMPIVSGADPEWFSRWPGLVRNRVTGKGQLRSPEVPEMPSVPQGWYHDSGDRGIVRWWDGARWTSETKRTG